MEMHERLVTMKAAVEAANRKFLTTASRQLCVSESGSAVEATVGGTWKAAVMSSPPLPSTGRSTWAVDILRCKGGYLHIGIIDAADETCAWALAGYSGPGTGAIKLCWEASSGNLRHEGASWPTVHDEGFGRVQCEGQMLDERGQPTNLKRVLQKHAPSKPPRRSWYRHTSSVSPPCSNLQPAATVEVALDHDAGTLSFSFDGGRTSRCLVRGLPVGVALKPFVSLYDKGDRVAVRGIGMSM